MDLTVLGQHEFSNSYHRFYVGATRIVTTIMIFAGLAGALGAVIDATLGHAYYDLQDALYCLGFATFGLLVRISTVLLYRHLDGAFK